MVLTDKGTRVEVKCSNPLAMQALRSGMRIQATGSWLLRIGGGWQFKAASVQGFGGSSLLPTVQGGRAVVGIWVGDLTGFWHAWWRLGRAQARLCHRAQIEAGQKPPTTSTAPRPYFLPACPPSAELVMAASSTVTPTVTFNQLITPEVDTLVVPSEPACAAYNN
jgi:hypothetical protein